MMIMRMGRRMEEGILVCLDLVVFMMGKDIMIVIDNKIIGSYSINICNKIHKIIQSTNSNSQHSTSPLPPPPPANPPNPQNINTSTSQAPNYNDTKNNKKEDYKDISKELMHIIWHCMGWIRSHMRGRELRM